MGDAYIDGLKPCPECMASAKLCCVEKEYYVYVCSNVDCNMSNGGRLRKTISKAKEDWNGLPEKLEEQCIQCGAPTRYKYSICKACAEKAGKDRDEYIAYLMRGKNNDKK